MQELFIDRILNNFTAYFDDLKLCCLQLWELFFVSPRADVKHDKMHNILQNTLNELNPEPLANNLVTVSSAFADTAYHSSHQLKVQEEAEEEAEEEPIGSDDDMEVEARSDRDTEEDEEEKMPVTFLYRPDVHGAFQHHVCSTSPVMHSLSPLDHPTQCRYQKQ